MSSSASKMRNTAATEPLPCAPVFKAGVPLAQTTKLDMIPTCSKPMSDNLIFNLIGLLAGVYLMHLWWADTRICISNSEDPPKGLLPGASLAPVSTCLLAIVGAVTIILIVSLLEKIMDVADNQTTLSWWFLLAMLGAAITEEVIFRGYLVVQNKGRSTFIMSILFFSSLFALIHPYLWTHTADNPAACNGSLRFASRSSPNPYSQQPR